MVTQVVPKVECVKVEEKYAQFVAQPLERGFSITLGNALRRVLYGSLPGAAVTWVRIEGITHEFSVLPHMKEDITEFLLNIRSLRLQPLSKTPGKLFLEIQRRGEVKAADIQPSADFRIVNPELHLATLDSPQARLSVVLNVEIGKGYLPKEKQKRDNLPLDVLGVDAIFTPIRRVNFTTEPLRIVEAEHERLSLEMWTDGSLSPQEALNQAVEILIEQLSVFKILVSPPPSHPSTTPAIAPEQYNVPIEELGISVRTRNALKRGGINTLGELLSHSEAELLALASFGGKALEEIREKLQTLGLTLWKGEGEAS